MALGLAGLLSISNACVKPKKEIKREINYPTPTLAQAADSLNVGVGSVDYTNTNPRYYMIKGTLNNIYLLIGAKSGDIETGDVKIIYGDKGCGFEGDVDALKLKYQGSLVELLKEIDINEPFFVIDLKEFQNSENSFCAEYKAKQEKEGTLAGTIAPVISDTKIGKVEGAVSVQQPASDISVNMYGYNMPMKEAIRIRALVAPSTKFIFYKDQSGKDRCKLDYVDDLSNIDQKILENELTKIDVNGDKAIMQDEAEKDQINVCREKKKEQDSKKEPVKVEQKAIEEENLEE